MIDAGLRVLPAHPWLRALSDEPDHAAPFRLACTGSCGRHTPASPSGVPQRPACAGRRVRGAQAARLLPLLEAHCPVCLQSWAIDSAPARVASSKALQPLDVEALSEVVL